MIPNPWPCPHMSLSNQAKVGEVKLFQTDWETIRCFGFWKPHLACTDWCEAYLKITRCISCWDGAIAFCRVFAFQRLSTSDLFAWILEHFKIAASASVWKLSLTLCICLACMDQILCHTVALHGKHLCGVYRHWQITHSTSMKYLCLLAPIHCSCSLLCPLSM